MGEKEEKEERIGSVLVNDEGDGVSVEFFTGQGWSTKVYLEDNAAWEIFELLRKILSSRWEEENGETPEKGPESV